MHRKGQSRMEERLSPLRLSGFVLPFVPCFGALMPVTVYMPTFYADDLGLGLAVVGTIFMLTRFWDVFSDPIFGTLSDNLHTRWGRRRPWIVAGAPLLMFSTYKLFIPPELVSGVYLATWLVMFYTGLTLTLMAMYAWSMELNSDYNERSRVMGYVQGAMLIGTICVLLAPTVVGKSFLGIEGAIPRELIMEVMCWFVVLTMPVCVLACFALVKEVPPRKATGASWREGAKAIIGNSGMRRVVLADFFGGLANGVALSVTILFARYDLGFTMVQASFLMLAYYATGFISIPVWISLSTFIGKHRALVAAALLFSVISLGSLLWLPSESLPLALLAWSLMGICTTAMQFLPRAMMSDVVDQDQAELGGVGRSGLYFSFLSMSLKLGYGLAVGIAFPILAWFGFSPGEFNSPEVIEKLRLTLFLLPAFMVLPIPLLVWNFPIDQVEQRRLRKQIAA